jgi:hypothetical protein
MKFSKYLIALSIVASMRFTFASSSDTLDLVGGTSYNFSVGWFGEAWVDSAQRWCGDTTFKDLTKDTTRDTMRFTIFTTITDTVITGIDTQYFFRDTLLPDSTITISVLDSTTVLTCTNATFLSDTGGPTGAQYINYYYKFRNSWAQLPFVWTGWQGLDSALVIPYKYLMVVYKGLLPTHQISMNFFYGAWSNPPDSARHATDSIKNKTGAGDGVGTLAASPNEWKTVIIKIPDSVNMVRITGLILAIGGAPSQTSDVGNLKVDRISLLVNAELPVRYKASPRIGPMDRFTFIPKTTGKVTISVYSLKGEQLYSKSIGVDANKVYSVKQLAKRYCGAASPQVRLLKIKGAGVDINQRIR